MPFFTVSDEIQRLVWEVGLKKAVRGSEKKPLMALIKAGWGCVGTNCYLSYTGYTGGLYPS